MKDQVSSAAPVERATPPTVKPWYFEEGSERITPALVQAAEDAEGLVRRGAEALREQATHLRERAADASDRTAGYIRDEPLKSVLIAAAAGAALMAIANLAVRARESR